MKTTIAIIAMATAFAVSGCGESSSGKATQPVEATESKPVATTPPPPPAPPPSRWSYNEERDEMRGSATKFAQNASITTVDVTWPYTPAPAMMILRKRQTDGLQVIIRIDGQFVCRSYSGDTVAVKFDDAAIQQFSCSESGSGTPGVLFINNGSRFLAALRKAQRVTVELPVYQAGPTQVTWDVSGLTWE